MWVRLFPILQGNNLMYSVVPLIGFASRHITVFDWLRHHKALNRVHDPNKLSSVQKMSNNLKLDKFDNFSIIRFPVIFFISLHVYIYIYRKIYTCKLLPFLKVFRHANVKHFIHLNTYIINCSLDLLTKGLQARLQANKKRR